MKFLDNQIKLKSDGLNVVLINGFIGNTTLWGYSLPERVKLNDAWDEDGECHQGATHGVDDDALGDELHVLVTYDFNSLDRLSIHCAGQFSFSARKYSGKMFQFQNPKLSRKLISNLNENKAQKSQNLFALALITFIVRKNQIESNLKRTRNFPICLASWSNF